MKKTGTILASLMLSGAVALGASNVAMAGAATTSAAMRNGSCAEAIDVTVSSGYRRSTLSCNGAVRSNTWRVHHTNGCYTDVTFYTAGDISAGTLCR